LPNILSDRKVNICAGSEELDKLCEFHEYDFRRYKGNQSFQKIARNLVDYEAGRTILETALGIIRKKDQKQIDMFEI
jgi:DNA (cytosine-5)-methyltransferase 1